MLTRFIITFLFVFPVYLAYAQDSSAAGEFKQYYFVLLTKGPNREQDSATVAALQKGHLDNINKLAEAGKLAVAGPFGDDGNWRGIFIFNVATQEEVEALLQTDPAIRAGRLNYEIHPWWTMSGNCFR